MKKWFIDRYHGRCENCRSMSLYYDESEVASEYGFLIYPVTCSDCGHQYAVAEPEED